MTIMIQLEMNQSVGFDNARTFFLSLMRSLEASNIWRNVVVEMNAPTEMGAKGLVQLWWNAAPYEQLIHFAMTIYDKKLFAHFFMRADETVHHWHGKTTYDVEMNQAMMLKMMESIDHYNRAHASPILKLFFDGTTLEEARIAYYRDVGMLFHDIEFFREQCLNVATYDEYQDLDPSNALWQDREIRFHLDQVWKHTIVQSAWERILLEALNDTLAPIGRIIHRIDNNLANGVFLYTTEYDVLHRELLQLFHHILEHLPAPYNIVRATYPTLDEFIAHYRKTVNRLRYHYQRHLKPDYRIRSRFVAYDATSTPYNERCDKADIIQITAPLHATIYLYGATRLVCAIERGYLTEVYRQAMPKAALKQLSDYDLLERVPCPALFCTDIRILQRYFADIEQLWTLLRPFFDAILVDAILLSITFQCEYFPAEEDELGHVQYHEMHTYADQYAGLEAVERAISHETLKSKESGDVTRHLTHRTKNKYYLHPFN